MTRRFPRMPFWALAVAIGAALPVLNAPAGAEEDSPRPAYVEPKTVQAWLDVRAADEFKAGHIPGAVNVVFDQVLSLTGRRSHDHPIVVYCIHSTHRAPEAARTLMHAGFTNVSVLAGGIVAWRAAGFTIQAEDLAKAPTILPYTERCSNKPKSKL